MIAETNAPPIAPAAPWFVPSEGVHSVKAPAPLGKRIATGIYSVISTACTS